VTAPAEVVVPVVLYVRVETPELFPTSLTTESFALPVVSGNYFVLS